MKYTPSELRLIKRLRKKLDIVNKGSIYVEISQVKLEDFLIKEVRRASKKSYKNGRQEEQHMMYFIDIDNFKFKK